MCLTQFCTSLITYCVILSVFGHFEKRSLNISFLFKWSCRMNGWTHCCLVLIANFVFKDAAPTLRFTGRIFELTSALGWAVGRRITRHTHRRTLVALCSCEKIFVKRLEFCSWCCALAYSFGVSLCRGDINLWILVSWEFQTSDFCVELSRSPHAARILSSCVKPTEVS